MTGRVQEVTVVGGGTAGWLTAMILTTFLNKHRTGPPIRVNVIESPKIPTIGVGEATVIGMSRLLRQLDISEQAFLRRCNASFKLSVRFADWNRDADGRPIVFYHPFNDAPFVEGVCPAYHFHRFGPQPFAEDFADSIVPNTALVKALKGPRRLGGKDYEAAISHAYHLDAGLFASFLRELAVARGVRHIPDDVVDVGLAEDGSVAKLMLEERGAFPVELVVDCTGFRSLILQRALGEPFLPFDDHLLCDRAIPVQIPHPDPTRLEPCTRSTALGAGWVWRVPLYNRVGTGYVYCSAFRDEDEARREFLGHLRAMGDLPADAPDPDTKVIKMRIGRARRSWVKNCVAIGLSGGFIEPLESTAIYMIEMAARWLVTCFPDKGMSAPRIDYYNRLTQRLYEDVRDFIVTHYYTANRPEPFWQAARSEIELPAQLADDLALWKHLLPDPNDARNGTLFNYWNYLFVLSPKGYFDDGDFPVEAAISRAGWESFGQGLHAQQQRLLSGLPSHYDLLNDIRGEAPAPEAPPQVPAGLEATVRYRPTVPLPTA